MISWDWEIDLNCIYVSVGKLEVGSLGWLMMFMVKLCLIGTSLPSNMLSAQSLQTVIWGPGEICTELM